MSAADTAPEQRSDAEATNEMIERQIKEIEQEVRNFRQIFHQKIFRFIGFVGKSNAAAS